MQKGRYILGMIQCGFVIVGLLFFMMKTVGFLQLVFVPFLLCAIAYFGECLFLCIEKRNVASFFHKLYLFGFLLFWFGFLVIANYLSIQGGSYQMVLFTIPFWIAGIYIACRYLFGIHFHWKNPFHFSIPISLKHVVAGILVGIAFLVGITCIYLGIKDTFQLHQNAKTYETTTGIFVDYQVYHQDEDGTTYQLTYQYHVDGKSYEIKTDYGTSYIPEIGTKHDIQYNPKNPKEAIIAGSSSSTFLIYFGAFFTLVSGVFIVLGLTALGVFDRVSFNVLQLYVGIVFFVIGIGVILLQLGITGSLVEVLKSMGLWILIPVVFILIGMYQIVHTLFVCQK